MLISHAYQFIFIKNGKVAGTSVEVDLAELMDEDDVVTPISPPRPGHKPRNYKYSGVRFQPHMPARQIKEIVGADLFRKYTKFTIEREPVDKALSGFARMKNDQRLNKAHFNLSWHEYMNKYIDDTSYLYTDEEGNQIVDHILKYEKLNESLISLMAQIGLPFQGLKSREKANFRKANIPTVEDVALEDRARIYEINEKSLKYTGYMK